MKVRYVFDGAESALDENSTRQSYVSQYTQSTTTTFVPPGAYRGIEPSFQPGKSLVEEKKVHVIDLDKEDLIATPKPVKQKSKKKLYLKLLVVAGFLAATAVAAFLFLDIQGGQRESGDGVVEQEEDFCLAFGMTDDEVRNRIAQVFEESFDRDNLAFEFDDGPLRDVECLPSNVFGALIETQVEVLRNDMAGMFFRCRNQGLKVIHEDAFPDDAVRNIERIGFPFCRLEALPDGVFRNFLVARQMFIDGNPIANISNDFFNGGSETMQQLFIGQNSVTTEFPLAMQFMPNLDRLFVDTARALVNANAEAFEGLPSTFLLTFRLTPAPVLVDLEVSGLAAALNLLESQIIDQTN